MYIYEQIMNCVQRSVEDMVPIKDEHIESERISRRERNSSIFSMYYGISGGMGASMQAVGDQHGGVTREAIRQILEKVECRMTFTPEEKEYVNAFAKVFHAHQPCTMQQIIIKLKEDGFIENDIDNISGLLLFLKKFYDKTLPDIYKIDGVSVFSKLDTSVNDTSLKVAIRIAKRLVSRIGIVKFDAYFSQIEKKKIFSHNIKIKKMMADILDQSSSFTLFKETKDLHFCSQNENRISDRLSKIFVYYEDVQMDSLCKALSRSLRNGLKDSEINIISNQVPDSLQEVAQSKTKAPKVIFTEDQILGYLKSKEGYTIAPGGYVSQDAPSSEDTEIGFYESEIVRIISESEKGKVREKEFENALVTDDKSKWHFSVALNYSPMFMNGERGEYKLIGRLKSHLV